ncbi:thioredoxin family protein [Paenibacillus chondroitinus]|uniref:Thioredoxin family protein n=1 Tax=Paenibacillus chondroitinus TaxID=59842 RepID=A0ABU6DII1_9BACL|nr:MULTISPECIES: thioredoxin family protein [Paenibacillus]MCY9662704.1 thioredoxin family protein [Paenibacillus anseongense]MEB4796671.1 thioredoxin family protein [Paenibacillus chondroitinus]
MNRIQTKDQYQELIARDAFTVMKFDTTWCPDCKNMDRFIGDIIEEQTDKDFYAIDAEAFQQIAEENDVRGIPSLLVFKNGEKIGHLHSKLAKTPTQVREYLNTVN